MSTTRHRTPRCSRGRLLAEYRQACQKAAAYGSRAAVEGAGMRLLEEARGRLFQALMHRWGIRRALGSTKRITRVLHVVEREELL